MNGRATKTRRALRDLAEIAHYIALDNPASADRFLVAAQIAFTHLSEMPGMGARRESTRYPQLRCWPITKFRNYLVFYTPTRRGIRVLRVLHGSQNIDSLIE
jgi:toxin ParE1/3/4